MSSNPKEKTNRNIQTFLWIGLVLVSLLWKSSFGFDADEQFAIATSNRFLQGQHYLIDLFDAYQISALFAYPIWGICKSLFGSFAVLAYRIVCVLIKVLCCIPLYQFLKKKMDQKEALLLSLIWITAFPKSIVSLEHSNFAFLFITYLFVFLMDWGEKKRGIALAITYSLLSLCYPTFVLVGLPIFCFLLVRKEWKQAILFVGISALIAIAIFIPVIIQVGVDGLLHSIRMILMDESHAMTMQDRQALILRDCGTFLRYAVRMVEYFIVFVVIWKAIEKVTSIQHLKLEEYMLILCSLPFLRAILKTLVSETNPLYEYQTY